MAEIVYLDLPSEIADIGNLPAWAHEGFDWDERTGIWRMTDKTRRYLNECREEIEALESEYATKLAEARERNGRQRPLKRARLSPPARKA